MLWEGEKDQWVKALDAKSDDLNSDSGTYMVQGKN